VTSAIRAAAPRTEIGVTTARCVEPDPVTRAEIIGQWGRLPAYARRDLASVNVHESGWQQVCAALDAVGIGVELGVWTSGDAVQLKKAGLPRGTVRVLAEVTVTDPDLAVTEAVRILQALGPIGKGGPDSPVSRGSGFSRRQQPSPFTVRAARSSSRAHQHLGAQRHPSASLMDSPG
jgi:hypothetical protein